MGWRRLVTPRRLEGLATVLFVLWIAWPYLHPSRVVVSFDGLAYSGPNLHVTFDALRSGRLPLWNDTIFGGVTHAGNPQTGFWYPPLALGLPFSATRAINVLTVLHLVVFAAGMWALCAWRLRLRPPSAFIGVVIGIGCGAMTSKTIQFEQLLVVAWVPLLLALIHWLVHSERPWRAFGLTAVVTGCWLTAGHPQIEYVTAPLLVVWALAVVADARMPRRVLHIGGAAALGALLALPHLLLAARATGASAVSGGRRLEELRDIGTRLQGRSIVTGLLGNPSASDPASITHSFEATTYVGAAALTLAVLGLATGVALARRRYTTIGLAVMAAFSLVLAAGPITAVFRFVFWHVPGFDVGRVSARWVLPASVCLAVLASCGADSAVKLSHRVQRAALGAVGGGVLIAAIATLAYRDEVPGRRVAAVWIVAAGATTAAWWLRPRLNGRLAVCCLLVPAVLVAGELGAAGRHTFARRLVQSNAPESATGATLEYLQAHPEGRVLPLTFDELGNPAYLSPGLRPNVNALFDIRSIDGYDGGVQITTRWVDAMRAVLGEFDEELTARAQIFDRLDSETWARLGVRYVLLDPRGTPASQLVPGWVGPVAVDQFELWENPAWLGDAVAWFSAVPASNGRSAASYLGGADVAARPVAVEGLQRVISCVECLPQAARLSRHAPGDLSIEVDLANPAVVTVAEQFDDGWRAEVDGRAVDVVAVDGLQMGVEVPPGNHTIRFTYRPSGLTLSILLSLLALLACAWLVRDVWLPRRLVRTAHRPETPTPSPGGRGSGSGADRLDAASGTGVGGEHLVEGGVGETAVAHEDVAVHDRVAR